MHINEAYCNSVTKLQPSGCAYTIINWLSTKLLLALSLHTLWFSRDEEAFA